MFIYDISKVPPQTNVNYKVDKVFSLKNEECIKYKMVWA